MCALSTYVWHNVIPIPQGSFKSGHDPPPLGLGVDRSVDNGISDGMFTHSVDHAGKQVSVKALRHGDYLFVYLSSSGALELSKEW